MVWAEHGVFNIEKKQERKYDERAASFNGGERRQLSRPFFVLCFPSIYFSRSHFKNKPVGLTRWIRWLCVCTCITLLLLLRTLQVFLFLCISLDRQPYCIETLRPVVSRELSLIVSRMNSWQIRLKFHVRMYVVQWPSSVQRTAKIIYDTSNVGNGIKNRIFHSFTFTLSVG